MPTKAEPIAAPEPPQVAAIPFSIVRFVSTDAQASFQRKTGTTTAHLSTFHGFASGTADSYDEICADPYELKLPAGSYTFAMSHPGGSPVDAAPIRLPPGPSKVIGTYESHSSKRTLGRVILLGSLGAGLALGLHGTLAHTRQECIGSSCREAHKADGTELGIGAAVMLAGLLISIPLTRSGDEVRLRVIPGVTPTALVLPLVSSLERPLSEMTVGGLTLSAVW